MKLLYLLINFFTVLVPLIFSFHPKLNFYKNWRYFFPANIIVAILFIAWDIYFTKIGVWGFNPNYVCGVYFFNLPLEEVLFFICIPFACVFTYYCLNIFWNISWRETTERRVIIIIASLLLIAGIFFIERLYTAFALISLSFTLILLKFLFKVRWLPKIISIYPVLLIPFFIVNGILTGFGLEQPVVWYNNSENLGIRMATIPFEDIFYGFELILLNVFLYERFKTKSASFN